MKILSSEHIVVKMTKIHSDFFTWSRDKCLRHRLIKTQIGHARDFTWYRGQRPSPARVILSHERVQIHACEKPLQLRDKSATLSRAWVVIVRHLDYILITRTGDGRWPRYQAKSLACPGCGLRSWVIRELASRLDSRLLSYWYLF